MSENTEGTPGDTPDEDSTRAPWETDADPGDTLDFTEGVEYPDLAASPEPEAAEPVTGQQFPGLPDAEALRGSLSSIARLHGVTVADIADMLRGGEEAESDADPVPRDPARMIQAPFALGWMLSISGDPIAVAVVSNKGLTEPYDTKQYAEAWLRDVATGMTWLVVSDAESHVMGKPHPDSLQRVTTPEDPNPASQQLGRAHGETIGQPTRRRWPFGR